MWFLRELRANFDAPTGAARFNRRRLHTSKGGGLKRSAVRWKINIGICTLVLTYNKQSVVVGSNLFGQIIRSPMGWHGLTEPEATTRFDFRSTLGIWCTDTGIKSSYLITVKVESPQNPSPQKRKKRTNERRWSVLLPIAQTNKCAVWLAHNIHYISWAREKTSLCEWTRNKKQNQPSQKAKRVRQAIIINMAVITVMVATNSPNCAGKMYGGNQFSSGTRNAGSAH